ncbi:MAG: non-ribosomal peptide synthetase [Blautia sp.]|nr:non-ribosomal peptide synthetase [Blautia sp.]
METCQSLCLSKKGLFDGTAIRTAEGSLSYRDFDELTDKFAYVITKKGVCPGMSVVLHMKRSIEMVIAMFGILKSGAALVPIVYDFPEKRLESVIASSKAVLVVTDDFYSKEMSGQERIPAGFSFEMAHNDDPGIILYTSGSTGNPKGVEQSQESAAFLFSQFPDNIVSTGIKVADFDHVIARLNHGFVVAYHYEYPVALLNGKTLILLDEDEQASILNTAELLEKNERCLMAILPSQLGMYLEDDRFCKAMKSVSCLGFFAEPIPSSLRDMLLEIKEFTGSIVTVFGQTETFGIGWQDIRAGKGMVTSPGVTLVSLDENGRELPAGERGELVVRTPSLFTSYLLEDKEKSDLVFREKNLSLNKERFVRTGDMGFVDENNIIHLAGRNDRMVKYHGQRVELPEIEEVMKKHPGIRSSCAIITKGKNGNDLLIAYYEGAHDQDTDLRDLRYFMMKFMPAYMIPVYFIRLDALPLNTNGKVDYGVLKKRELRYEKIAASRPMNELESFIADCAAKLLGLDSQEVDAESNLMALGMDSLNAVLLINRLAEKGYSLSIEDFITSLSVEDIAAKLRRRKIYQKDKKNTSALVECTDMQTFWIRNNLQVVANIVAYRGIEEEEIKKKTEMLPKIHPALRSSFIEDNGIFYTKVLKDRPMSYRYMDIRERGDGTENISLQQKKIIQLLSDELFTHPDPSELLYVIAIRTHDDKTVLEIRFDHRVVDAVGEKILFQEFLTKDELDETDNYIEYLEFTAEEKAREDAVEFWKEYLDGVNIACVPGNPCHTGKPDYKKYRYSITGEQADRVRDYCRREAISLSAFVLCQYARAVMEVLGQDDIVVPMGISGRSLSIFGMDRMVGCIVNAVPVRIKKTDTERDFMQSYLKADQYGFLQEKVIFKECFGMETVPKISPYIVGQIFPEQLVKEKYNYFSTPSYNLFNMGEFLWEDEDGIHLLMHPDIDLWDEKVMDQILKKTEDLLERKL